MARVPQIRQAAQSAVMWGEKETGWEAYISGKPSQCARNIDTLGQAAGRLGVGGVGASTPIPSFVPAAAAPAVPAMPSSFAMKITNWTTGEARMVAIADRRASLAISSENSYRAASRRAGRRQ